MQNNSRTINVIAVFLIIIMIFMTWNSNESKKDRALNYYYNDLDVFITTYGELISLLEEFIKSPNIENYSKVQVQIGRAVGKLGSLDRTMSECYKLGLLENEKLKYKDSDVTVLVTRIIKDSNQSINESIEIKDSQMSLDENKINLVIDNLKTINDLLKPYYETSK